MCGFLSLLADEKPKQTQSLKNMKENLFDCQVMDWSKKEKMKNSKET